MISSFPNQARKPVMGTAQPPWGSPAGRQIGWAAMETRPKALFCTMNPGGGERWDKCKARSTHPPPPSGVLRLAWWMERKAAQLWPQASCSGSCCPPCWLLPLPPPFLFYLDTLSLSGPCPMANRGLQALSGACDGALPPHNPFTLTEMTWSPTQMTAKEARLEGCVKSDCPCVS